MSGTIKSIGIIGAGKLGITLARIARSYGFDVYVAGSGDPKKVALSVEVIAPGAIALTAEDVAQKSDVVILALPLGKFRTLSQRALAGKLVIDAMNYWWEVDGEIVDIIKPGVSSSESVQEYLRQSRVVKAFNHMGYHDLYDEHKPRGVKGRKAIAIAGEDTRDVNDAAKLVDDLGFDPLVIGTLADGIRLEPGTNAFGANLDIDRLNLLLNTGQ